MFQSAMRALHTFTKKGALSLSTPDDTETTSGRLAIFFKAIRGISQGAVHRHLLKASEEDIIDTFVLAFHTRDSRGGKGERDIGRIMFRWLAQNHTELFLKVLPLIPEYGRWDDILNLVQPSRDRVSEAVINLLAAQLQKDREMMLGEGNSVSLAAKWAPTENDSTDRELGLVQRLCDNLGITRREYRQVYLSPLRSYLNIVERLMCGNKWSEIDFSKVPSCAMQKLKKAFERHTTNFAEWKSGLKTGETKVNSKQLFPHEIIKELRESEDRAVADELLEAQWKVLEDEARKLGSLGKCVVVVDVSSSMETPNYLPLDISTSLGLLIASLVEGPFHNNVITFETRPTFIALDDGPISERYSAICRIPWGGCTNLRATFDLILERAKLADLPPSEMPEKLFIISDMQFDKIDLRNNTTNFQYIDKAYRESGYTRPQIVFWNANGDSTDYPVSVKDDGTCLLAGASPSVIKSVFESVSFTPDGIMRACLDSARYQPVRELLLV